MNNMRIGFILNVASTERDTDIGTFLVLLSSTTINSSTVGIPVQMDLDSPKLSTEHKFNQAMPGIITPSQGQGGGGYFGVPMPAKWGNTVSEL